MDYGMGSYDMLNKDDFKFIPHGQFYFDEKPVIPKHRIGLPKWTDMEKITGVGQKACLKEYSKRFNAIELNATHYQIYSDVGIKKWVEEVEGRDFLFCPKMYKGITHFGTLRGKETMVKEFCNSVRNFGDHLGPLFMSLSHNFSPARKEELYLFLQSLPLNEFHFFLELRHEGWYADISLQDELNQTLHQLGIGKVITDTPLIRNSVEFNLLQPAAFIRFVCKGNNELDFYRIKQWKDQLTYLSNHGIQNIYFFLHIHDVHKIGDFSEYVQSEFVPAERLRV